MNLVLQIIRTNVIIFYSSNEKLFISDYVPSAISFHNFNTTLRKRKRRQNGTPTFTNSYINEYNAYAHIRDPCRPAYKSFVIAVQRVSKVVVVVPYLKGMYWLMHKLVLFLFSLTKCMN